MDIKKASKFLVLLSLLFLVAGCDKDYEIEPPKESLESVLEKSFTAAESIESFHLSMEVNETSTEKDKEPMQNLVLIEMDLEMDPIGIYQNLNLPNLPYEMEIYITESGSYTKDSVSNVWIRTPHALYDSTVEGIRNQYDAITMLENIKKNMDEFDIEEENDYYYISFELTDEYTDDLIKAMMESEKLDNPYNEDMDNIRFSSMRYHVIIEKETYYPKEFYIKTTLEILKGGEALEGGESPTQTVQIIQGKYSNINKVDKITLPKDVK